MILAPFWENPAVVGLIIAMPATVLGYLGWLASKGRDEAVKEAGLASGQAVWIGQVQDDNRELRQRVDALEARLGAVEAGSSELQDKNRKLEVENAGLRTSMADAEAKIKELEAENKTLKARVEGLENKANGA